MKVMRALVLLALILPAAGFPAGAAENGTSWRELAERIAAESRESEKRAEYTLELVRKDRQGLEAELERLKSRLESRRKELASRKRTFQSLLEREKQLEAEIEEEKEEIKQVQDTVFNAAQKTSSLIGRSPVSAEHPERFEAVRPLLSKERFPGMQGIRDLVSVLETEMRASGEIRKYEGDFIGPDGRRQNGTIVRAGAITAAYRLPDKGVGYLTLGKNRELTAVSGEPSWFVRNSLAGYIKGESGHMPLDLSGGSVFKRLSEGRDFTDWVRAGGLLVWPIFLVGAVALILAAERFVFLLRIRSNSDRIMSRITDMVSRGRWQECRDYCARNRRFPTCRVLGQVLEHLGATREAMENAIQEAILRQVPRLERFIPTLSILGAIAPLLGLLGTVTGMINTFQVITLFGTGDPKLMSGGISEALVTTQLGLAVAIPIMLLHHVLERRVDKILSDIEEKGNAFTLTLLKQGAIKENGE
jgi:biopolymer transport protein ExbB